MLFRSLHLLKRDGGAGVERGDGAGYGLSIGAGIGQCADMLRSSTAVLGESGRTSTLAETSRLVNHVDGDVMPRFDATLEDARKALGAAERVMNDAQAGLLGPDAPAQQELRDALQEVTNASRALRALADSLQRHPESLIRGRSAQKE